MERIVKDIIINWFIPELLEIEKVFNIEFYQNDYSFTIRFNINKKNFRIDDHITYKKYMDLNSKIEFNSQGIEIISKYFKSDKNYQEPRINYYKEILNLIKLDNFCS